MYYKKQTIFIDQFIVNNKVLFNFKLLILLQYVDCKMKPCYFYVNSLLMYYTTWTMSLSWLVLSIELGNN